MGNLWDGFDSESGSESLAHESAPEHGDWANSCTGQLIQWLPGSVWDSYAYHRHTDDSLPWTLISVEDPDWIRIRARRCNFLLHTELEQNRRACVPCQKLANSAEFKQFMSNASKDLKQFTPIRYLNQRQLRQMYLSTHKKFNDLKLKSLNSARRIKSLRKRVTEGQRLVMLMSKHKIASVSRILSVALRNGASPAAIHEKLEMAISGAYAPRSKWTDRELDVAFLIKSAAGSRLLYTLQREDGYPSRTMLYRRKNIPELRVSVGIPNAIEINKNIETFLGSITGRQGPETLSRGQTVMIDGLALEEVPRYDLKHNHVIGLCREHSGRADDVKRTVLGLAPISADENYFVSPLVLSGSCKSETGNDILIWITTFVQCYYASPHGRMRHGDLTNIATDGESSFRKMRFLFGYTEDLDRESKLGELLYRLPGFNCQTGIHQIITTCDPKHVIKRFATMIRSPTGIQIGDTQITAEHIFEALTRWGKMPRDKAYQLLHPADKQNVPKAVNLLQSLFDLEKLKLDWEHLPSLWKHFGEITFLARVLSYFLFPFVDVEMSLAHQIQSISTFAHLITAMFQKHKTSFLTSALIADSQAIAKSVIFNTAQLQIVDPESRYYILFEGTNRLEGVFSHARTQDHARNFDILQLAQKLSIGAEVNAIFQRYPDLDCGHIRRNLAKARGVDHVNPKSWIGDVHVKNVDIKAEYYTGRDKANTLLREHFGEDAGYACDFDKLFSDANLDHLCPGGSGYIGYRSCAEEGEIKDDSGIAHGALTSNEYITGARAASGSEEEHPEPDVSEFDDPQDTLDPGSREYDDATIEPMEETLNPEMEKNATHYIIFEGRRLFKPELISRRLSSDSARKVTIRPLRAQGVSVLEMLNRRLQVLNQSQEDGTEADTVKVGDLGAALTRVGNDVCLAIVEVLNFRQTKSKNINLTAVDTNDLDFASKTGTTIAVQILDLAPAPSADKPLTWIWTRKYIQLQPSKDGTRSQRHLAIRIPGMLFFPLGPDVIYEKDSDAPRWSLKDSELKEVMDCAWEALSPDSNEILNDLEALPLINGAGLPYRYCIDRVWEKTFVVNLPPEINLAKKDGKDEIECFICAAKTQLRNMRKHVGKHILLALRRFQDRSVKAGHLVQVGIDPCGWCGRDGCKTQLSSTSVRGKNKLSVTSNCPFHYNKMIYSRAAILSTGNSSTNVPALCPLCPIGLNEQGTTFWKYNLIYHMATFHLTEAGELPRCPPASYPAVVAGFTKKTRYIRIVEDKYLTCEI
ncbi:hypothetical protein B0H34DRAFT_667193 [Crassisporium funariophilum]|nr:hypothetical protein B0H34DRAFT_667193 [Crassisporium funariophilum]